MIAKRVKKGDTIGIIAPSNPITQDRRYLLDNAIRKLKDLGLNVVLSENCLKVDKYRISAGEPEARAEDLNAMFSDKNIDAIWCAHGGETANQILELIDYENIKKNPKVFLGMSDIDVLHLAIHQKTGMVVFNSSDPKSGRDLDLDLEYTWNSFIERMFNCSKEIPVSSERKCVRKGVAEGKLLGCNLASIIKLAGTQYFPDFSGTILFVEGYTAGMNHIIWKLEMLKQLGVFDKIKGIVIGYIYGFQSEEWREKNNITAEFEDIVLDITKGYAFPILKTNDFGHRCPNCFLPIGAKVRLDAANKQIQIIDDFLD